ncbi:MAG: hypothetical protein ABH956_03690 [Candidatus Nealsonbacteria bacterium]
MYIDFAQFNNPMSSGEPEPSKGFNKSIIIKIIIGVIILVTSIFTIILATRIWDPVWNPFRPSPEKILEEAIGNMKEVKAFHINTGVNVNDGYGMGKINAVFDLDGDIDMIDSNDIKAYFNFDLKTEGSNPQEKAYVSFESEGVDKTIYFKLNNFDIPGVKEFLMMFLRIDINQIQHQWIKFGDIKEETDESEKEYNDVLEELIIEVKPFSLKKELKDEKINNQKMYHYIFVLDSEKMSQIYSDYSNILKENSKNVRILSVVYTFG